MPIGTPNEHDLPGIDRFSPAVYPRCIRAHEKAFIRAQDKPGTITTCFAIEPGGGVDVLCVVACMTPSRITFETMLPFATSSILHTDAMLSSSSDAEHSDIPVTVEVRIAWCLI